MAKVILINARDVEEARVAVVDNDILEDFHTESAAREQLKGNIYKGQIVKIEPSIQAAFVNYGGQRDGFLPIGDVHPKYYVKDVRKSGSSSHPRIQEVLKRKQEVVVQVVKEAIGNKGAALTTHISLPGRYLVLMPDMTGVTRVSRKIEDEQERKKLKELLAQLEPPKNMGFIVRTAGLSRTKQEVVSDLDYLVKLWENIQEATETQATPALIYKERDLMTRTIRDYFTPDIKEVVIDNDEVYQQTKNFFNLVMPRYLRRVKRYTGQRPLYSHYNIEPQLEAIFQTKVALKSGGSIVIEPTEALVSIDVNSGRATRGKGIEETATRTNLEAAVEVARQLRLRDLGGLVMVDFIDMYEMKNRQEIERTLRTELKKDKAKVQVSRISKFGILELSRQRMHAAIRESSHIACPTCHGAGMVKSREVAALTLLRQLQDAVIGGEYELVRGQAPVEIASYLLNFKRHELNHLEKEYGTTIVLEGSSSLHEGASQLEFVKKPPSALKAGEPKDADKAGLDVRDEQVELATARAAEVAGESVGVEVETEPSDAKGRRRKRAGRRRSRGRRRDRTTQGMAESDGQTSAGEAPDEDAQPTAEGVVAGDGGGAKAEVVEAQAEVRAPARRTTAAKTRREKQTTAAAPVEKTGKPAEASQPKAEKAKAEEATSPAPSGIDRPNRKTDEPFVIEAVSEPLPGEVASGDTALAAAPAVSHAAAPAKPKRRTTAARRKTEKTAPDEAVVDDDAKKTTTAPRRARSTSTAKKSTTAKRTTAKTTAKSTTRKTTTRRKKTAAAKTAADVTQAAGDGPASAPDAPPQSKPVGTSDDAG